MRPAPDPGRGRDPAYGRARAHGPGRRPGYGGVTLLLLCLFVAVGALASCTGIPGVPGASDPFRSAQENQITIQVENLSSEDMRVAVLGPTRRFDLGNVNPRSTGRYAVPWSAVEPLRIQVEPLTGSPHTLPPVTVEPGDHLELFLHTPASRSTLRR